ncbi:MAG: hypothetical protein V4598_08255 [Bdellovibrionota bacterium]
MKNGIGLFLFLLSFNTYAGTSGTLVLRALVPATFSITMEKQGNLLVPVVHSNRARVLPKVSVSFKNNARLVSVVHP